MRLSFRYLLLFGCALIAPAIAAAQDSLLTTRVDALLAPYADTRTPGAAVGVVQEGRLVFARGYGMADLAHGLAFTPETASDLGSVSKQFTAFALLLLADEGRLGLDDDIRLYLPDVPDFGTPVTLRHLLNHTGGYREVYTTLGLEGRRDGDAVLQEDALRIVRAQPELQAPPGSTFAYNNTGYMLLAEVVERVTGTEFHVWMTDHVFASLGMHDTAVMARPGQIIPHTATSYRPDGAGGFVQVFDNSSVQGAGGIYSTVADLARWVRNLSTSALGGPDLPARLAERSLLSDGDTLDYALGVNVGVHRGLRRLSHNGSSAGYRSYLAYYPDIDGALILLTGNAAFDFGLVEPLAELFFGAHLTPVDPAASNPSHEAEPPAPPTDLTVYTGRFFSPELETVYTLRAGAEGLTLSSRRLGPIVLDSTDEDRFAGAYPIGGVVFERNASGRVTGFRVSDGPTRGVWFERMD